MVWTDICIHGICNNLTETLVFVHSQPLETGDGIAWVGYNG
jgi:hypothetical protein